MSDVRLADYLEHIERAAQRAVEFAGEQTREEFLSDVRTQQAVAMSFAVMGEAATKISILYPDFAAKAQKISWQKMRGMRHHIVHGYFRIDYELVWDTVQNDLPALVQEIAWLRAGLSTDPD